ncbi:MAG: TlpA disulfide reductase family protein [Pseudomonadota bacterium]
MKPRKDAEASGELPLRPAIITAIVVGALGVLYVLFSSFGTASSDPLGSFATGEMRTFRSAETVPPQPLTTLATADGSEITLADKRGKILLVNFWATWCAPCVEEMPYLDTLQARYGSEDFEVVAVSMDTQRADAAEFLRRHELTHLALYHDPSLTIAFAAGAPGLPVTILYDRHGGEIGRLQGEAKWASDDAFALIEAALARY